MLNWTCLALLACAACSPVPTIGGIACPTDDVVVVPVGSDLSQYSTMNRTYILGAGTYVMTSPMSFSGSIPVESRVACYVGVGASPASVTVNLQMSGMAFNVINYLMQLGFQALTLDGQGQAGAVAVNTQATLAMNQVVIKNCPLGAVTVVGAPSPVTLTSTTISGSGSPSQAAVVMGAAIPNVWSNVSVTVAATVSGALILPHIRHAAPGVDLLQQVLSWFVQSD